MVRRVDRRDRELRGLRLQNDLGTKVLFTALSVVALLFLAAIAASPARAYLVGDVTDQATEAEETATAPVTDDGTSVEDEAAPAGEETIPAPPDQVGEHEIPPVADQAGVSGNIPSVAENEIEVMSAPLVVDPVLDGADALVAVEDSLTGDAVIPVVEGVEDVSPFVETADEVRTLVTDVMVVVPAEVLDLVRVLPLFESPPVTTTRPVEIPPLPVMPAISVANEVVQRPEPVNERPQQLSGLFTKELVAEMTLFNLTNLTVGSAAVESSASPVPERETPAMAAYVPVAGTMPVLGGAGTSSSSGSSNSGAGAFGGLDAFNFLAAMAALLALCLLGWIRDRSRSGRSIFPSHGGRPG